MGVITCLDQGGLRSPSASSSTIYIYIINAWKNNSAVSANPVCFYVYVYMFHYVISHFNAVCSSQLMSHVSLCVS